MRVNLSISPEMARRVRNRARREDVPESVILRRAVANYLGVRDTELPNQRIKAPIESPDIPPGVVAG